MNVRSLINRIDTDNIGNTNTTNTINTRRKYGFRYIKIKS